MGKSNRNEISFRINDEIRLEGDVRVIGDGFDGTVMPITRAKDVAGRMNLDVIEVNNKAMPPLVRIADYSKFLYETKKKAKANKQKPKPLKEIQLSVNISSHDIQTKANNARKFIGDGSKVKVVLKMKGRELTRREENKKSIFEFLTMLEDVAAVELFPKDEGNKTISIIKPKK